MKFFKKIKKGFTLVELVVVIAVIAILSGVGVGTYIAVTNNAKQSAANQEAVQLKTAIQVQTISTWEGKTDGATPKSYSVTWDANEKAVLFVGLDTKAEVSKALDDLVADSQGLKGYVFSKSNAEHYFFFDDGERTNKDLFTFKFGESDEECVDYMVNSEKVGMKVSELRLYHTNGFNAVVLDANTF